MRWRVSFANQDQDHGPGTISQISISDARSKPAPEVRYEPRRPQETLLYRVVREHLSEFIQHAADSYERPLPRYVVSELEGYLRCGQFYALAVIMRGTVSEGVV